MVMASEILDDWERKVLHNVIHAAEIVPNSFDWLKQMLTEDTHDAPDHVQANVQIMLTKLADLPWSQVHKMLIFCRDEV